MYFLQCVFILIALYFYLLFKGLLSNVLQYFIIVYFLELFVAGKTMSHFKVLKHKSQKSLSGYLSGISVDECADACLTEITFDCYSFVYCPRTGVCLMAKTYAQQRPDLVYDRPNCDLFYSKTSSFYKIVGLVWSIHEQIIKPPHNIMSGTPLHGQESNSPLLHGQESNSPL